MTQFSSLPCVLIGTFAPTEEYFVIHKGGSLNPHKPMVATSIQYYIKNGVFTLKNNPNSFKLHNKFTFIL